MARPLIKQFRNHDTWYHNNKRKFGRVYTNFEKKDMTSKARERKHQRAYYRNEINDRVYDILARGYGIYNANKRELFPFVLSVLNGHVTPSQAAYNFAASMYDDEL